MERSSDCSLCAFSSLSLSTIFQPFSLLLLLLFFFPSPNRTVTQTQRQSPLGFSSLIESGRRKELQVVQSVWKTGRKLFPFGETVFPIGKTVFPIGERFFFYILAKFGPQKGRHDAQECSFGMLVCCPIRDSITLGLWRTKSGHLLLALALKMRERLARSYKRLSLAHRKAHPSHQRRSRLAQSTG